MRAFVIIVFALVVFFSARGIVGIAHAQVTDCTNKAAGTQCIPLASGPGASGLCEPSSNLILGGMVCQPNTTQSPATNPSVQAGPPGSPPVQAGPPGTGSSGGQNVSLTNPLKGVDCSAGNGNCLEAFLLAILNFVILLGSIVIVLMLVFVGYKFVAAQGAPAKLDEAKQMLMWTIIGALVLLGAQTIAMSIQATVAAITGGSL